MKIVITGSLGNISKTLTEKLISKNHEITVISSDPEKRIEIERLGATAAIGSLTEEKFVREAFIGAQAVYTMVPPNFSTASYSRFTELIENNYKAAIEHAGLKFVVNLSSAASPISGVYPFTGYYSLEKDLDRVPGINILHLRAGMFYNNLYGNIPTVKNQGIIVNNFDENAIMNMSHPFDIANAAAAALDTLFFKGINVKYIVSSRISGKEIIQTLGKLIGKRDLNWVQVSDEQLLHVLVQNGLPEEVAKNYIVAAGIGIREGVFAKYFQENTYDVAGDISFQSFAAEWAMVYQNS